ncbi:MAG: hypothetical protein KDA31_07345 [Phycisphaerales bacterium]|nr:hypothetical protein [Phycisphaerales bacterium]
MVEDTHERIPRFSERHTSHFGIYFYNTVYEEPGHIYAGEWLCQSCGGDCLLRERHDSLKACIDAVRASADAHSLAAHEADHESQTS